MDHFDGPSRKPGVNLSTGLSSSSADLLSSVRAERHAREQRRLQELASVRIQRAWRRRLGVKEVQAEVLRQLQAGAWGWRRQAGGLVLLLREGWGGVSASHRVGVEAVLRRWAQEGMAVQAGGPWFVEPLLADPPFAVVLALLAIRMLELVAQRPATAQAAELLTFLESLVDPAAYAALRFDRSEAARSTLVDVLGRQGWVQCLTQAIEQLIAASPPKKKHSHLLPCVRLTTAPLTLAPSASVLMYPALVNELLAIPSLPSALPLPALSHLSTHLQLFTALLPYAASQPSVLQQGRLTAELGRTHFLANLATFGITGGMLQHFGIQGMTVWILVVGTILGQAEEGWGPWVEGREVVDDEATVMEVEHDEELEPVASTSVMRSEVSLPAPPKRRRTPRRDKIAPALAARLLSLASPSHITMLANALLSSSANQPASLLHDFSLFVLALLDAFRGSARWESILDSLISGQTGRVLGRRLWREGVRGQWRDSAKRRSWETFQQNPSRPCLLLLTQMMCHYLILTPDDEFFAQPSSSPLSVDEVLDISSIWRDLAYWGFMDGVAVVKQDRGEGTEDVRSLFTRGVTRVAERNARRKFAPDEFWAMVGTGDMEGFVQAAVFEDAQLSGMNDEDAASALSGGRLPVSLRARQRYSKRQMAYISPRLGLLNNLPMAVPFQTRLQVFREFVENDRERLGLYSRSGLLKRHEAKIHRETLAEDGFRQLNPLGPGMKASIYIRFYDQWGQEEMGIDGGGLFKEFFTSLSKEAFNTDRGLWLATSQNELYPNPHSYAKETHQLSWYGFIGRVLGKALYEGILIDVSFAGFFLAKWLGRQSYLDDLASLDPELYKGLVVLKNYPQPEELSLSFTITEEEFGVARSVDLIPNGSEVAVTAENRHEYIQMVCKYKLDRQIAPQSAAFFNGLADIIDPKWLRMFDQQELRQLIGGEETPIDMDDLRTHAIESGFPNDRTMRLFWKVVKEFSQEEKKALLRFVTSCPRPPLLGFAYLNPKFGIRFAGPDTTRLPSASSCANLLKLPGYVDEQSLRIKLLQAITSGAGFDLS